MMFLLFACAAPDPVPDPVPDAPAGERIPSRSGAGGPTVVRVTNRAGEVLPGAPVGWEIEQEEVLGGYTGADGQIELVVPPDAVLTVLGTRAWHSHDCGVPDCFVLRDEVPQVVTVLDEDGFPVVGAEVVVGYPLLGRSWHGEVPQVSTDELGRARVYAPLGAVFGARTGGDVVGMGTAAVILDSDRVAVYGRVTDAAGAPVAGAAVRFGSWGHYASSRTPAGALALAGGDVQSEEDGFYVLAAPRPARGRLYVHARKPGWIESSDSVRIGRTHHGRHLDVTLTRAHAVALRCAGLPDDSCASIEPHTADLRCSGPDATGEEVYVTKVDGVGHLAAECPVDATSLSVDGLRARFSPSRETAWLDFRGWSGGVRGRVKDTSRQCTIVATPARDGLLTARRSRGPLRRLWLPRSSGLDFEISHLGPGRWTVSGAGCGRGLTSIDVDIAETIVDIGEL